MNSFLKLGIKFILKKQAMNTNKSIINAKLLLKIQDFACDGEITLKIKEFPDKTTVNTYSFLNSFDNEDFNLGVPLRVGLSVSIFFWAKKPKKRISTSIPNAKCSNK